MVRSKEAPKKKPKDPLLTPPSKPRGGFVDEPPRPWNRGGAAMSPAPASVPSYMRGTSSSDAKAGRRGRPSAPVSASASPARWRPSASASPASRRPAPSVSASASPAVRVLTKGKVLFPDEAPGSGSGLGRATCSSTMKDAKFPDALDLAPGATVAEGPAAMRVCPYTYCSLNGHVHSPAVPLRSFLASRRRLIKTQQSMKLKGVSAFRKKSGEKTSGGGVGGGTKIAPLIDEEAVGDFFVEVYTGPRVSTDMSCSDMSLDEMDATVRKMEFVMFDRCGADEDSEKGKNLAVCDDGEPEPHLRLQAKHGAFRDSPSECSEADTGSDFVEELPWMRYNGYDYDDSLDGEISEEQRMRGEESGGAEVSVEQAEDQGTSGRSADDLIEEAAQEQEKNDAENTSNLVCGKEIVADQGVACRAEACQEPDGRFEENILNKVCFGEASAGQGTAEEQLSEDVYKSDIPEQEVIGWVDTILEESCRNDTSADREANDDECSVQSDGESEATEEQVVEDEESTPDDGSEMEISEDAMSGYGCREDFSDEVTSRAVLAGRVSYLNSIDREYIDIQKLATNDLNRNDSTADDVFEQYDNTADGVSEQDGSPANAQKELGLTTSILEDASEETGIAQERSSVGIATHVSDGEQMKPMKDASEESSLCDERNLHDNAELVTDGAEMGPEITRCKLEDADKETEIDQETVGDEDSAFVSGYNQNNLGINECKSKDAFKESTTLEADLSDSSANIGFEAQDTVEDDDSACVGDDAQNDLDMSKHNSDDASKESAIAQEADQSDTSANVSSDAQNESELTTSESAVFGISDNSANESNPSTSKPEDVFEECIIGQEADYDDSSVNVSSDAQNESELTTSENEPKPSTCKPEDVFEESIIGKETDHDDSSSCVGDCAQNEYEVTTCLSEGVQPESDVIQEDKDVDNTAGAVKKSDVTTCESGGGSSKCSMPQETDGDINIIDASEISENATTMPKFDACEDIHVTEETNQSFIEQIPAEFTDAKEPSIDDICSAFSGMNLKGDVYFDPAESATCPRNKLIISRRRRTPEEEEYLRGFNPRAPNFLSLEVDPDAEKVDLKHQMIDERKNAEEWMIDYALRRAVTNLAPARKKKVELLVQAFETVLPHDEDDKKSITPTRPAQACN
ncbi:hypothetical protein HU200_024696 [Digitaria exilis]|uniref:Calmodulin-binding domain-containing protein n=1 Tax=Digitaria exilis TaxID=1010633 RepID=A0A835EW85_9POAL|nr:hypothetical protein HU200_024696 [Digitaria exilis]CAB3461649.1 unnamed protein product [Digitaria exilis]